MSQLGSHPLVTRPHRQIRATLRTERPCLRASTGDRRGLPSRPERRRCAHWPGSALVTERERVLHGRGAGTLNMCRWLTAARCPATERRSPVPAVVHLAQNYPVLIYDHTLSSSKPNLFAEHLGFQIFLQDHKYSILDLAAHLKKKCL